MKRVVVFLVLLWVLAVSVNAQASTRQDAVKAAWYLKGEGDLVMPTLGQVITDLTCRPTKGKYVVCALRSVSPDYQSSECSHGKFVVKGFIVNGQWSKPRACPPPS